MLDREEYDRQKRARRIARAREETEILLSMASWKLAVEFALAGMPAEIGNKVARAWLEGTREALQRARDEAVAADDEAE